MKAKDMKYIFIYVLLSLVFFGIALSVKNSNHELHYAFTVKDYEDK